MSLPHAPSTNSNLLSDEDRTYLRQLVVEHTVAGAARLLGLSRGVVSAAAGGIEVRRGSIELVREALTARRQGNGASKR